MITVDIARENVKAHREELQRFYKVQAEDTTNAIEQTIENRSKSGYTYYEYSNPKMNYEIRSIVRENFENRGFTVYPLNNGLRIMWE